MEKLKDLLAGLEYECICGSEDIEVSAVVYDSRKVEKDCMFICIVGANVDGHTYAKEVTARGAKVLVVSKDIEIERQDVTVIKVADTRYAMAFISAAYFHHPAEEMKIIGITGTKGKTTTTYLIKAILENAGHKVGLVGTIETIIGDEHFPAKNTTPESYILQEYFRKMADAGCDAVVMEVSSQGLMLHRTQGFIFDIGILRIWSQIILAQMNTKILKIIWHVRDCYLSNVKLGLRTVMTHISRQFLQVIHVNLKHMDLERKQTFVLLI